MSFASECLLYEGRACKLCSGVTRTPKSCTVITDKVAVRAEQAKESAVAAVRAATDSASLALQAVETSVQHYVETRDYMRLKDMAEASAVAGQVF